MVGGLGDDAVSQSLLRAGLPVDQLDDRDYFVSPAGAGPAGHHDVVNGGVLGDRGLYFFGEDLLAAGVDGDRIPAEQLYLAVGPPAGPITGDRVPDPLDDRERPR